MSNAPDQNLISPGDHPAAFPLPPAPKRELILDSPRHGVRLVLESRYVVETYSGNRLLSREEFSSLKRARGYFNKGVEGGRR